MTTFERNDFVKSPTTDLARQVDTILDQRYESEDPPQPPRSISFVRILMNTLSGRK